MYYLITFLILIFSCNAMALEISSDDFNGGEYIPSKCAYDKSNIQPSLYWTDIPDGTKSLALICDDPDAPAKTWVHWVVFNIPPDTNSIPEEAIQGINDFGKIGYGGPCPPPGKPHRYFFKIYALDTILPLKKGATKEDVLGAMEGHTLASAEIVGLYKR